MNTDFEYAVLGGGGMGSASAYYLAREGKSVVVLEQFEIGHNRGASHGESRIIRYSYEWVDYIKLAKEAYRLWHETEKEWGSPLFTKTGGLDLGYPGNTDFEKCIECLTREEVDFELLDTEEIKKRFPQFQTDASVRGLYQKDAGFLQPDKCVPAFLDLAKRHSAVIHDNTAIDGIEFFDKHVEICAGDRRWRVKKLIICAGPWTSPLLKQLTGIEIPIKVTLEQYAFFKPRHKENFDEKVFPVFIMYVAPGPVENLYGFPYFKGIGVKVAEHRAGFPTDADSRPFEPEPERLERLVKRAQKLFPDLTSEVVKTGTCLYSNTPDHHFIIDKLAGRDNVLIGAGFSGHGFKFIPIVGNILKELALGGQTERAISMFSLSRFSSIQV